MEKIEKPLKNGVDEVAVIIVLAATITSSMMTFAKHGSLFMMVLDSLIFIAVPFVPAYASSLFYGVFTKKKLSNAAFFAVYLSVWLLIVLSNGISYLYEK